jgi:O-methyltransferase
MSGLIRTTAKRVLAPVIYKYPPFGLQPERLATYLHGLLERKALPGDVAEIGCNLGGTSAIAARMLKRVGWMNRYICYDTFSGFVAEQFEKDVARGTEKGRRDMFAANSMALVRKILDQHGVPEVELVPGDITTIPDQRLSAAYSVVLLDIDLADPTYGALKRFWPRLVQGGVIYVDDCPGGYNWKARIGYEQFCREAGLTPRYEYGLGVLNK